jgi:hypothetical protein
MEWLKNRIILIRVPINLNKWGFIYSNLVRKNLKILAKIKIVINHLVKIIVIRIITKI